MIHAISLIPSGGICMLHACICGPSVLEDFEHTGCRRHGPWRLWHAAVGCQTCTARDAFFRNEASKPNSMHKNEKDVSVLLCNHFPQCLSATFLKTGKLVGSRMKLLKELYGPMPDKERKRVVKWAKQQITENHSNCTSPPSNSSSSKKLVIKSETTSWKKKNHN